VPQQDTELLLLMLLSTWEEEYIAHGTSEATVKGGVGWGGVGGCL